MGGDSSPEDLYSLIADGELIAEGFEKLAELDDDPTTAAAVMRWAINRLPTILTRWKNLRVTTQQYYAAIDARQQRYAHEHDLYRGALQDADRALDDLGVTNPPPRFVEALALGAIQR
ncbi:hypothetical protein ACWIGI_28735 [Nocardia sp. NPDC055321]